MDQVRFHVGAAFADAAVSPGALAAVDFCQVAVHADEKYVQAVEEPGQSVRHARNSMMCSTIRSFPAAGFQVAQHEVIPLSAACGVRQ